MHPSTSSSTSFASFSLPSESSESASSLKFGKAFFKSIFLNINEDVQIQPQFTSPLQQPQSHPTTPAVLPIETKALMDVFLDQQQRVPLAPLTTQPITTRLPPELRFLILRYATYPPFPWSTTATTSSELWDLNERHFYSHPNTTSTIPFHIRLSNYTSEIKWKASLTRVCKEWNLWGQEFLWEDVWISSGKDGRVLLEVICEGRGQGRRAVPSNPLLVSKEKEKIIGFSLKRLRLLRSGSTPISDGRATPSYRHPQTRPSRPKNVASYIRKLHIETPSMDRCCAFDLMSILERCERLEVFIDLRSVRRAFGFVGIGVGADRGLGRYPKEKEKASGPATAPGLSNTYLDPILQALTTRKPTLKHLSFTNYKYDSDDFEGGIWFWEDVVGRALNKSGKGTGSTLESLEVVMSTRGVGMGNGRPGLDGRSPFALSSVLPSARFDAGLLTSLDIPCASTHTLFLPSLHSLRIPLTSPTLLVISTWSLPSLQSLCVVSIDFTGWRRVGFKKLMDVHGSGLIRFEIVGGGDESVEEEGWITEREDPFYNVGHPPNSHQRHQHLHLPSTSPNLKHFICSTNASEWNWETPDWIAPHVLMPEHFGVERIGVWGLERKVVRGGDWEEGWSIGAGAGANISAAGTNGSANGRRRRTISTWATSRWNRHSTISDDFSSTQSQDEEDSQSLDEQPFFMLQEQFGSLLRKEAFPSLVCIRDMSWESDSIRRSVGIGSSSSLTTMEPIPNTNTDNKTAAKEQRGPKTKRSLATFKETVANRFASFATESGSSPLHSISPSSMTSASATTRAPSQSQKILKFWLGVLEMCDQRGVYLEDWMGRRVVA